MSSNDVGSKSQKLPEWLTEEIFTEILKTEFDDFKQIKDFNIEPAVKAGENFMTVMLKAIIDLELKDSSTKQKSFMIKIMPNIEKMQELLKMWRVFEKEKTVYTEFIPEFEKLFQRAGQQVVFGAKFYNVNTINDVVVLEDLKQRNFKNIDRLSGLDRQHTERILDKLAQFHAASACWFEKRGPYPDIYNKCLNGEKDSFLDHRLKTSKTLRTSLSLCELEYLDETLENYVNKVPDQFQLTAPVDPSEFNVLNHGDLWCNNIMFQYDEKDNSIREVYFVDYQMSRYGSPAHDLLYLLISSTCLKDKIRKFDYFISYYHSKLLHNLKLLQYPKKPPTLKDLHIGILQNGDWAYTIITTVMPVLLLDRSAEADINKLIDEESNLRNLMFTNDRYISHIKQLLPWMHNRGLLEYE